MSNFDFGLSNQYLKFGVSLILLGPALIASVCLLGAGKTSPNVLIMGIMLLMTGCVVYVIGRIVKAASSKRE